LLVEDDADQRQLISEALRLHYDESAEGGIVSVATGGECLQRDPSRFDVVLLDYNLPDVQGLELLEKILARKDLPVIFVTGENDFTAAAEALRRGAQDYVVKLGDYLFALPALIEKSISQHRMKEENERLRQELQSMLSELRTKNIQLEESLQRLQTMVTTDHLTGLANRRRFSELLERCYSEAVRYGFDLTCCMCDLDNYKQVNDALGHLVGDELLIITADVIRSSLRSSDVAARYGGDEFVLLLSHTSIARGAAVGERIRRELASVTAAREYIKQPVTLSIGIASYDADNPGRADALVAMADRALYVAKKLGKDRMIAYGEIDAVEAQVEITPQ
jgi:two-component system chemotaxis family response regulator WspR